jgi:hypothetical protein
MAEPIFGASFRSSSSSSGLRAVALISNDLAKMSLVKLLLDFAWRAGGLTSGLLVRMPTMGWRGRLSLRFPFQCSRPLV